MISTVIFDLDDTLYDESDYCRSGFKAVAEFVSGRCGQFGSADIFDAFWEQFAAGNYGHVFNAALENLGIEYDNRFIAKLVGLYREHRPEISLPAESAEVLTQLHGKYKLALLTDGFMPAQRLKVEALGLERFFETIVYTEELGREFWKPSPVAFEKLVKQLGQTYPNTVYVADNEAKDFIGPNKLGIRTIQLTRPNRIHKKPGRGPHAKAEFIIRRLRELPPLLQSI